MRKERERETERDLRFKKHTHTKKEEILGDEVDFE